MGVCPTAKQDNNAQGTSSTTRKTWVHLDYAVTY
jgi:hypothetical protein